MPSAFETQIAELARSILNEYQSPLSRAGLRADFRGVNPGVGVAGQPASELLIDFYRADGLADVFEFFVERAGTPTASAQEIEEWLRRELAKLVEARAAGS